jgi:glycosyltransferase involved in cell wall biosynthesis
MSSPEFTVIVPTHRRAGFLDDALASLRAQTVEDFECVVVDDASPEPPALPEDPRFRLVRREVNGGPAAARNTGLQAARGRFVAFLDDDDLFTPERLALGRRGLASAPLTICWRRALDGSPGSNRVLEGDVSDSILDQTTPHLGQVTVERSLVPRFDERFVAAQDVEWWLRAAVVAPISTVPEVGYLYRRHDGPRGRNSTAARVRCSLRLLELHAPYFERHPRAAAFRWKRIGLMAGQTGDRRLARQALRRSLRLRPELATLWHLARAFEPPPGPRRRQDTSGA